MRPQHTAPDNRAMHFPRNPDLHCHSLFSDGTLAPAQLAQRAAAAGVDLWALTDHDTIAGLYDAQQAASAAGVAYLTGSELSTTWHDVTVHIVGLGVDPGNAALAAGIDGVRASRTPRAREMARLVERETGADGAFEGALRHAGNPQLIARPHFARFLVERGICRSSSEAFQRFLATGRPCFVPQQWATLEQAIGWIRTAGGMAVMAHPGKYPFSASQRSKLFEQFTALGGEGVEVVQSAHNTEDMRIYTGIARRFGLFASRGSDFHSPSESRINLGALPPLPDGLRGVWEALEGRILWPQ